MSKPELKAKDMTKLLTRTLLRYRLGEISDQTAYKEAYLVNTILKSIEVTDLQERLERIEGLLKDG